MNKATERIPLLRLLQDCSICPPLELYSQLFQDSLQTWLAFLFGLSKGKKPSSQSLRDKTENQSQGMIKRKMCEFFSFCGQHFSEASLTPCSPS